MHRLFGDEEEPRRRRRADSDFSGAAATRNRITSTDVSTRVHYQISHPVSFAALLTPPSRPARLQRPLPRQFKRAPFARCHVTRRRCVAAGDPSRAPVDAGRTDASGLLFASFRSFRSLCTTLHDAARRCTTRDIRGRFEAPPTPPITQPTAPHQSIKLTSDG